MTDEASLEVMFDEIQSTVRDYLGESTKDVTAAINGGYRMAITASPSPGQPGGHAWRFLSPTAEIILWPAVAVDEDVTVTGTEDFYDGVTVLTASADAFYPTMVGTVITITDVGSFTITEYTSATEVTVAGDASCDAKTFSIPCTGRYSLPADYGSPAGSFAFASNPGLAPIDLSDEPTVRRRREFDGGATTGYPSMVAVVPRNASEVHDPSKATAWDLLVWPTPGEALTLSHTYNIEKPVGLDYEINTTPVGDLPFQALVIVAAVAYAEFLWRGGPGAKMALYQRVLADAVANDEVQMLPRNLGANEDRSDAREWPITPTRVRAVRYIPRL